MAPPADWLNYHHLLYFWTVAREGSVARAAARLSLAQPTVSAQVRALEDALGEPLFTRTGRRLVLTDVGRVVLRYADEIFATGRELLDAVRGRPTGRPIRFAVGVADALPKMIAYRLLEPAWHLDEPVPDEKGRLFSFGTNTGNQIEAPPGKDLLSSSDTQECAEKVRRQVQGSSDG